MKAVLKSITGGVIKNSPWIKVEFKNGDLYRLVIHTDSSKASIIHLFEKLVRMMKEKEEN